MDTLKDLFTFFGGLESMPGYGLTFLFCITFGYLLKATPRFPNNAIPMVVILAGGLVNCLLATALVPPMTIRIWLTRNIVIGLIVAVIAWLVHKLILKRFIDKWFPNGTDNTTTFTRTPQDSKPNDKTNEEPK